MHWHIQSWLLSAQLWTEWKTGTIYHWAWQKLKERYVLPTLSHLHSHTDSVGHEYISSTQLRCPVVLFLFSLPWLSLIPHWTTGSLSWRGDICVCVSVSPPYRAGKQSVIISQAHAHHPLLFGTKTEQILCIKPAILIIITKINNIMLE